MLHHRLVPGVVVECVDCVLGGWLIGVMKTIVAGLDSGSGSGQN